MPNTLSPAHEQYFLERAIKPDRALAHEFHSVDGAEAARLLGRSGALASGGIAMPYAHTEVEGRPYVRIRCDEPDLCGARYLAPAGATVPVYVPGGPLAAGDPILVVESPVKAVALAEAGLPAIGLGGVATTLCTDDEGPPRLNASWWDPFGGPSGLKGRQFVILFDTNRGTNPQVARAEARLAVALTASGAVVKIGRLNTLVSDVDAGPDDVLAKYGRSIIEAAIASATPANPIEWVNAATSPAELLGDLGFRMAVLARVGAETEVSVEFARRKWPRTELNRSLKAAKKALAASANGAGERVYLIVGNRLVEARGEDNRVLADFAPRIVEEVHRHDGVTSSIRFTVEATAADGSALGSASIAPADLQSSSWAATHFGNAAIVHEHPREIQAAMQSVSTPKRVECRTHLGWFATEAGVAYAHAGGVLGDANAAVEVPGELASYVLPDSWPNLSRAFALLLSLSAVVGRAAAVMLIAAVPDALLQHWKPSPFVMALLGSTGAKKTSIAHVVLSAFADLPFGRLTTGFESTMAALENVMFAGKDALVGIDDFVPGTSDPRADTVKKAEDLIRRVANRTSRSRMTSTMATQLARPPRAAVLVTGEERPGQTQSIAARLLAARIVPGSVKVEALSELQRERHKLRELTAALIAYLSPRAGYLAEMTQSRVEAARAQFQDVGGHARVAESLAHLRVSFGILMDFGRAHNLLSPDESSELLEWGDIALRELGEAQRASSRDTDPVARFLDILMELEANGRIRLPHIEDGQTVSGGAATAHLVGWRVGSTLLLLPNEAFNAVSGALRAGQQGDLGCKASELWQQLGEKGYLVKSGAKDRPYEAQYVIDGRKQRVRVLRRPVEQTSEELRARPSGATGGTR